MAGRLSGSIRIGAFAVTAALLTFGVGYTADAATPPPSPGTNGTGAAPGVSQQAVGDPEPGATLESSGEMVVGVQPSRLLDTRDGTGARAGKLAAGESISVKVTGRGGVPDVGVAAVVLNVTGTEASEPTFLTAWPTGAARPNASNLNLRAGADTPNAVVVKVGRDGMVDLFNFAGATHVLADVTGWIPIGFAFTPLVPSRVLDTRDGTGAPAGVVGPGGQITLDVTGVGGVPDSGVGAVVLNITGTEATAPTFVTVWPDGDRPNASSLNLRPGVDTPNLVIARVGADGAVRLFNFAGSTHLIADVEGWIPAGPSYQPLVPSRVLDTRQGIGAVPANGVITVDVTGVGGVPDAGVGSVVLNVTGTEATAPTFVTVWPDGDRPNASNLNLRPGVDSPNMVITKVGADGQIRLYNFAGSTQLIVDVVGWIATGASTGQVQLAADSTLVGDADVVKIEGGSDIPSKVILSATSPIPVVDGYLIVSGVPGFLGQVVDVIPQPDGTTVVNTVPTTVDAAFAMLDLTYQGSIDGLAHVPINSGAYGVKGLGPSSLGPQEVGGGLGVSWAKDALACDGLAVSTLTGGLDFSNSDIDFDVHRGFLGIEPRLKAVFTTTMTANVQAGVSGQGSCSASYGAVWVPVPIGPVWVIVEIGPRVSLSAEATATFAATATANIQLGLDAGPFGTDNISDADVNLTATAEAEGSISATVGAFIDFKAFGAVGVGLSAGPKITGAVDTAATPCLEVFGSLNVGASISAGAFGIDATAELSHDFGHAKIYERQTCTPPPPPPVHNLITFSEVPLGSDVTDQYLGVGVRFAGDSPFTVIDGSNATSPVLSGSPLFFGAIEGWFTQPGTTAPATVNSFALDVGYLNNAGSVAVSFYDTNGQFLGYQKTFELGIQRFIIGHQGIGHFRVQAVGQEDAGFAIDNLTW